MGLAVRNVLEYLRGLAHLLHYSNYPAFAVQWLSVIPGTGVQPERRRSTLPRHRRGS